MGSGKKLTDLTMGVKKLNRAPQAIHEREIFASRVLPFRFAFAGFDLIDMLPKLYVLPQQGADIELVLKKRNRVLIEIMKELIEIDS